MVSAGVGVKTNPETPTFNPETSLSLISNKLFLISIIEPDCVLAVIFTEKTPEGHISTFPPPYTILSFRL